jgi:NAD(P)-dependent dehydrogenase (short-subunit alcohol dehydrogenase family)
LKAALITGGSSGIGLGLAAMFVELGFGVTIVARGQERLRQAGEALRAEGGELLEVAADVGRAAELVEVVGAHADRFGRLDALVNSAGVALPSEPGRLTPERVAATLAVDLESVILSYWASHDMLRATASAHGVARVFNIASITARAPQPWLAVYSSAKAAVVNYTSSMNQAYAAEGVLSTAVCPGYVATPMSEGARDMDADTMITVADVVDLVRPVMNLSARSYVPELVIARRASQDPSGL